jgi:hypothetical protein
MPSRRPPRTAVAVAAALACAAPAAPAPAAAPPAVDRAFGTGSAAGTPATSIPEARSTVRAAGARRAPLTAFSAPAPGRPVRALDGTVADGAQRVEVAVLLRAGTRCRALRGTGPAFAPAGGCAPSRWLPAEGRRTWRLTFRTPLPRGRYLAYVRAVAPGTVAWPFTVEGGNRLAFTVTR